ncbi:hypothetical protein TUM20985_15260 [Mycobacterium antarcticum]|uniref:hypothetical protein n=1 Tax=unclassified Mycolicibacterium TaxID=2636767 RepID=UPI00238BB246|nr:MULTISPECIES: hypothetical protein [unclassified Mycolicibacterium]BDX30979.1 hypothetical protein TUM20985_15260 [Mycolicibacterium sp. TUM20985]GLP74329.1 hypothetical protein TUM20983_14390 [Mycolicibacterium sp. TUM20983]GLP80126.1 hypothetical protein TUM20984_15460 [Mycolicibacterium sp. TUM20984]
MTDLSGKSRETLVAELVKFDRKNVVAQAQLHDLDPDDTDDRVMAEAMGKVAYTERKHREVLAEQEKRGTA